MVFYGRERELALLRESNWRGEAQLVVVYGRRRIGKTALVHEAYRDELVWAFDGLEGVTKQRQLEHFCRQLTSCSGIAFSATEARDWPAALRLLVQALKSQRGKRLVLFLDEFQWMARMRSPLVAHFKSLWDQTLSKEPGLRVVLCGSVSSFMVKKVLRSRALYGRVSTEIDLRPLSLAEAAAFFGDRRERREILEIAMTLGCVPQYLKELNPRLSFSQNLNEYAFSSGGYFLGEYQRLFISHFGKNPAYEGTLDKLSKGPRTATELARACKTKTGGTFSSILEDLQLAGFIEKYSPLGRGVRSRLVRYRILDEYLHFYFRFIHPRLAEMKAGQFSSLHLIQERGYSSWQGYAFERLARRNAAKIADHLRFSGVRYKSGSWFVSRANATPAAQVDLLFERADRVLTVCEAKYRNRLNSTELRASLRRNCDALRRDYPGFAIQRVLLLGKPGNLPIGLRKEFDEVLQAEDMLFDE